MLACDIAALIADRTGPPYRSIVSTWKFGGFVIARGSQRKRACAIADNR